MVTTVLDREVDLSAAHADSAPPTPRREKPNLQRPPTLFGQTSPWELVEAGHALARQAIGYRSEGVGFDDAAAKLLQPDLRRDVLQMARDYLAYTRFDVPLETQVDALFVLDDVLYRLDLRQQRNGWLARALARMRNWLNPLARRRPALGR
jgi:hypothetical protein